MRRSLSMVLALAATCVALAAYSRAASHERTSAPGAPSQSPIVTPVEGVSNFHRLGLEFESSGMGRTDMWGPAPESYQGPPVDFLLPDDLSRPVVLSGADLYRIDCQACHRADGNGAPPEIPAISGPVQATSAELMELRMKERGRPITAAFARELASGSQKDLLNRLKNGGQKMPAFGYLTDEETRALIGYLGVLAGLPGHPKPTTVTEPPARVGELVVKSTCHICHDARGNWPDPEQLLEGTIPPISGFTAKKTMPEFIWKVRHGAPVVMGALKLPYRGRMPVFYYLSDGEVGSAYLYLLRESGPVVDRRSNRETDRQ